MEHAEHEQAMIDCTFDFGVQNLEIVHVVLPVLLHTEDSPSDVTILVPTGLLLYFKLETLRILPFDELRE